MTLSAGDRAPAFTLPDAFGESFDFSPGDEGSRIAIVFYRSAVW